MMATSGIMATQMGRPVNQAYKAMPRLRLGDPSITLQTPDASRIIPGLAEAQGFMQVAGPRHMMPRGIQGFNSPHIQPIPPIPWAPASLRPAGPPLQVGPATGHAAARTVTQVAGHSTVSEQQDGTQSGHSLSRASATPRSGGITVNNGHNQNNDGTAQQPADQGA